MKKNNKDDTNVDTSKENNSDIKDLRETLGKLTKSLTISDF